MNKQLNIFDTIKENTSNNAIKKVSKEIFEDEFTKLSEQKDFKNSIVIFLDRDARTLYEVTSVHQNQVRVKLIQGLSHNLVKNFDGTFTIPFWCNKIYTFRNKKR